MPVSEVVIAGMAGSNADALLVLARAGGHAVAGRRRRSQLTDGCSTTRGRTSARLHRGRARATGGSWRRTSLVRDRRHDRDRRLRVRIGGRTTRTCALDASSCSSPPPALVGNDRALEAAQRCPRPRRLAELLPHGRAGGVVERRRDTGSTTEEVARKALREQGGSADGRRGPKPTELRRVCRPDILMAAATFLGFYLIVAQFAGDRPLGDAAGARSGTGSSSPSSSRHRSPSSPAAISLQGAVAAPLPYRPGARRAVRQQLHRPHRRHAGERPRSSSASSRSRA